MDARAFALEALAFVLTYSIHSTLLLGAVCLLSRRLRPLWLRERAWKVAMLGSFVTALIQVGARFETPFAHWTLRQEETVASVEPVELPEPNAESSAQPSVRRESPLNLYARELMARIANTPPSSGPSVDDASEDESEPAPATIALPESDEQVPPPESSAPATLQLEEPVVSFAWLAGWRDWTAKGLVAWAAFAALVLAGFAGMWLRLARRLRGRVEVHEGDLRATLDRLVPLAFSDNRRVRLYLAPEVAAPVSFGFLRPSICVPPRAEHELSADEKETMLAHELAHLARRDPLWLSTAWLIERVFFFQPLNRVARAELHDIAELMCDDWAVTRTGHRLALASCLARIAEWIVGAPRALPATSMAEGHRSRLTHRIERLLDDEPAPRDERPRRWIAPVAAASLSGLVLVVPGVCAERGTSSNAHGTDVSRCEEPSEVNGAQVCEDASSPAAESVAAAAVPSAELAHELALLDESVELLESELDETRAVLQSLEPDSGLHHDLEALALQVHGLDQRRTRLHALIDKLDQLENHRPFPVQGP